MTCLVEQLLEDGDRAVRGLIASQRGYWDRPSFLRAHGLPLPAE